MPPSASTAALRADPGVAGVGAADATPPRRRTVRGDLAAAWGVAGQIALVATPSVLLLRAAVRGLDGDVHPLHGALAAASLLVLGYFQGYRGFQRRYGPFVAARAAHLARNVTPLHALLAPLYVCGLVGATARRRARTAFIFAVMPLLAVTAGRLPDPYRACVDLGVAFGLAWGAAAIAGHTLRVARGGAPALPLDLPGSR